MTAMNTILPTGLAGRIVAYFEANPGEELLYADACVKFGCTSKQLYVALGRLRAARGGVESVQVIRAAARAAA